MTNSNPLTANKRVPPSFSPPMSLDPSSYLNMWEALLQKPSLIREWQ
jgi:hypothetical protein